MNQYKEKTELHETIRILERNLGLLSDSELSCCGITLAQCHAIVEIGRGKTLSLVDLAEVLNLDNSTLSRTVNHLVNKNLARRESDPKDRRYVKITLTEEGNKIFQGIESSMEKHFSLIYDHIPENKRAQVVESLQILVEVFSKYGCC